MTVALSLLPDAFDWGSFGQFLIDQKVLTRGQVTHAQHLANRWGSDLPETLLGAGLLSGPEIAEYLASFTGLASVDLLLESAPNFLLLRDEDRETCLALKAIPYLIEGGRTHVACAVPTPAVLNWATARFGASVVLDLTDPADIVVAIRRRFVEYYGETAQNSRYNSAPDDSARTTFSFEQKWLLVGAVGLLLMDAGFFANRILFVLTVTLNLYYASTIFFRSLLMALSWGRLPECEVTDAEVAAVDDRDLPPYTVLVAMYKEAGVFPILVQHLRELDYPRSKLDIKIVLEEDDTETLEIAKSLRLESFFEFLVVPPSAPQTKPKALNYALPFARGDYLTIYDAEDRPERDQLKKACIVFKRLGNVSCVQARLNYFNRGENFITRMFTIEYSQWFDNLLVGMYRLKIPIPLGGTSNHFRTSVLRELGAWDPYNVTEDADLGVRMEKNGHRVALVNSTTFEEANTRLGNWIRQRSRWMKGHMMTFLVHMRDPMRLYREVGFVGFFGFALFIGGPALTALLNPLLWGLFVASRFLPPGSVDAYFPSPVREIAEANLILGNGTLVLLGALSVVRRRYWDLLTWSLLLPVYWAFYSVAAYKALWQLLFKPHYWEKTTHGLSALMKVDRAKALESIPREPDSAKGGRLQRVWEYVTGRNAR